MPRYFNYFPKLIYTSNGVSNIVTDLMTRPALIQDILNNSSLYYEYDIQEGDTPEMIASKYYGDPELHWIILITNQITDPFYDWPMTYQQFSTFIADKYGSQANASITIHHYEKIITSTDGLSGITTSNTFVIPVSIPYRVEGFDMDGVVVANVANSSVLPSSNNIVGDCYQTLDTEYLYVWDGTKWAVDLSFTEFNSIIPYSTTKSIGTTKVTVSETKQPIDCLIYEETLNESKRTILLIKKDIISDVKKQFINLMST
jgi:hypothetical protein